MTKEEKVKAELSRIALIKKWPKRLKKLRTRKTDPLKESEFCDRYDLPRAGFNRMKNLVGIATKDNVDRVEAAFAAEKV